MHRCWLAVVLPAAVLAWQLTLLEAALAISAGGA
jgi:hypothetical protein